MMDEIFFLLCGIQIVVSGTNFTFNILNIVFIEFC